VNNSGECDDLGTVGRRFAFLARAQSLSDERAGGDREPPARAVGDIPHAAANFKRGHRRRAETSGDRQQRKGGKPLGDPAGDQRRRHPEQLPQQLTVELRAGQREGNGAGSPAEVLAAEHPPREGQCHRSRCHRGASRRAGDAPTEAEDQRPTENDVQHRAAGPHHHRGERVADAGVGAAGDHVQKLKDECGRDDPEVGGAVADRRGVVAQEGDERVSKSDKASNDRYSQHKGDPDALFDQQRGAGRLTAAVVLGDKADRPTGKPDGNELADRPVGTGEGQPGDRLRAQHRSDHRKVGGLFRHNRKSGDHPRPGKVDCRR